MYPNVDVKRKPGEITFPSCCAVVQRCAKLTCAFFTNRCNWPDFFAVCTSNVHENIVNRFGRTLPVREFEQVNNGRYVAGVYIACTIDRAPVEVEQVEGRLKATEKPL